MKEYNIDSSASPNLELYAVMGVYYFENLSTVSRLKAALDLERLLEERNTDDSIINVLWYHS